MSNLLNEIKALVPTISARAAEIEAARRLPADLAALLAQTGVFRMLVPADHGGLQVEPRLLFDVLETLGSADAAVGWCAMIAATSGLTSAYLAHETATEIFADPLTITGGVFAPMGKAIVDGDDYIVSGRWQWASGSANCHWLMGGCIILDDGRPRLLPNGMPDARMMLFPRQDVTLIDTWHVVGLCGTGSGEMEVRDLRVPKSRSVSLLVDKPTVSAPLYAFPSFGLLAISIAAVMLGNAQGAMSDVLKTVTRKPAQPGARAAAERATVQATLAEATARLRSARAYYLEALDAAWRAACASGEISADDKASLRLAATFAVRTSAQVVTQLYELGGGSSVFLSNSLQRRFRDAHVGTQHLMVSPQTYELVGRILAGLPTDTLQL